jgi:hypothetical protein
MAGVIVRFTYNAGTGLPNEEAGLRIYNMLSAGDKAIFAGVTNTEKDCLLYGVARGRKLEVGWLVG